MDKELPVSVWPEWKIIEKIGEGSFGKVYKAQRTEKGKEFYSAIKVITIPSSQSELNSIRSETANDQSAREYFQNIMEECIQEVSTMEYFRGNSHVVSVEDYKVVEYLDAIGWDIFIRMEYLTSFLDYCSEKQLTGEEVVQLGIDMCKALEYCQKLHIIHRDIKPENIFVSRFGEFKLGDFGIARELERTMSGMSKKGTYSYMAPEMYRGEQYDSRVDIYSLGIVLYRLCNRNRLPFLSLEKQLITYRDKENALARRMSGETLPKPAEAGEALARVILKACAYKPEERYQEPGAFRKDLESIKYGRTQGSKASEKTEIAEAADEISREKTISAYKISRQEGRPGSVLSGQASVQAGKREPGGRDSKGAVRGDMPRNSEPAERRVQSAAYQAAVEKKDEQKRGDRQPVSGVTGRKPGEDRVKPAGRCRKKSGMSPLLAAVLVMAAAVLIAGGIFFKMLLEDSTEYYDNGHDFSYMLPEPDGELSKFEEQMQKISDQATEISHNLQSSTFSEIGSMEDGKIAYIDEEGRVMKVLVYPSLSEEGLYEEYYYWENENGEQELFFAYIWSSDEDAQLYYYAEGSLIRWIDEHKVCHDNETDNSEYVERGERYWNNAQSFVQGMSPIEME